MSNFHGRMVNIPMVRLNGVDCDTTGPAATIDYKEGHKDARHAAAEIANEADRQIEHLLNDVGRLSGDRETILRERDEAVEMLKKVADDRDHLTGRLARLQERIDLYSEMMGDD